MNISFQFSWGRFFILCLLMILPLRLWAGVEFWKIFPNTVDDANLEYTEFRNAGCEEVDIGGYVFSDASGKNYTFPTPTKISSHESLHLSRTVSKIILNNEDETLFLKKPNGELVDTFSYSSSTKGEEIIDISVVDETCQISPPVNTGGTQTGSIDPPPTQTGSTGTGSNEPPSNSGGSLPPPPSASGGTVSGEVPPIDQSGSTSTGIIEPPPSSTGSETPPVNTGSTVPPEEGILFPELIPYIQSPTNAAMSGETFSCIPNEPCRINISFEEIFTGPFLMRDYICEMITGSGTLTTCNPNTMYFGEDGSFGFRLTSKKNPSKMKSQYWNVEFRHLPPVSQSGSMNTGEIVFPEILPTFQNYTNTTLSGNEFLCTTSPCRLNFTLEPIFTGALHMSDFTCQVVFGTGTYDTCNPPQLYPFSGAILSIILTHTSSAQIRSTTFLFRFIAGNSPSPPGENPQPIIDTNPPVARVKFDGKIHEYHEFIGENELTCYTFTCAVNLSAEDSYDREGSKLSYLWYYGANDIKTTRDPGERKYGIGEYQIWLRVIDEAGNVGEIRYKIHVVGPREKEQEEKKKEKKSSLKSEKEEKSKKKSKKKKKLKMEFFEPPEILLQSKKVLSDSGSMYTCITKTKTCSLNLALSGTQKSISYVWTFPDGERVITKNPKSHPFNIGVHDIHIAAFSGTGSTPFLEKDIRFTVTKENKKSKKSKKGKKKISRKKNSNDKSIPPATIPQETENLGFSFLSLLFMVMVLSILRIQKGRFLSKFRDQ